MTRTAKRFDTDIQWTIAKRLIEEVPEATKKRAMKAAEALIDIHKSTDEFETLLRGHILAEIGLIDSQYNTALAYKVWDSMFKEPWINQDEVFGLAVSPRDKIVKMMPLTETQLLQIAHRQDFPVFIRVYAKGILAGDIKTINSMLDQSLGTPLERRLDISITKSPLEELSVTEIRALLKEGEA